MKLLLTSIVLATLTVSAHSSVKNESNLRVLKSAKGSKTPKSVKSVKVEKSMKSDKAKAAKSEKSAKADESKSAKAGVEGSKTPKGKGGGKGGEGKAVKSAKDKSNKSKTQKGKKGGSGSKTQPPTITQSPCPNSVALNKTNAKEKLLENSSDKETIKCFDTSQVTIMNNLFLSTDFNADISSWDVSSVTAMDVSFHCS